MTLLQLMSGCSIIGEWAMITERECKDVYDRGCAAHVFLGTERKNTTPAQEIGSTWVTWNCGKGTRCMVWSDFLMSMVRRVLPTMCHRVFASAANEHSETLCTAHTIELFKIICWLRSVAVVVHGFLLHSVDKRLLSFAYYCLRLRCKIKRHINKLLVQKFSFLRLCCLHRSYDGVRLKDTLFMTRR